MADARHGRPNLLANEVRDDSYPPRADSPLAQQCFGTGEKSWLKSRQHAGKVSGIVPVGKVSHVGRPSRPI